MKVIRKSVEFEWDEGNSMKNEKKHGIANQEAEKVFLDADKIVYKDTFHSVKEERFIILGRTNRHRLLYVVFTYRGKKIRVISARIINKKEVHLYEKKT